MVAIYIAGFVIFFAVANVVYKASARLAMKSRTRISATTLVHASPDEPVIVLGSSPRLPPQRSAAGRLGSAAEQAQIWAQLLQTTSPETMVRAPVEGARTSRRTPKGVKEGRVANSNNDIAQIQSRLPSNGA